MLKKEQILVDLKEMYNKCTPVEQNIFAQAVEFFLHNNDEGLFMSTISFYGILSDNEIKAVSGMITPFIDHKEKGEHYSYGLEPFGYTARLNENIVILPGESQVLTTLEEFNIPNTICAFINNKSNIIKKMAFCVFASIEPGYKGTLSFPIFNMSKNILELYQGEGIAQVHFIRPSSINNTTYTARKDMK